MRRFPIPLLLPLLLAAACREPAEVSVPRQVSPNDFAYPLELYDEGIEGETTLALHVTPTGTVDSARVEKSSGYPAFDSAAVAGGRSLRFEPAMRGEEAVATWVSLPVRFTLPKERKAALQSDTAPLLPADDLVDDTAAAPADSAAPDSAS